MREIFYNKELKKQKTPLNPEKEVFLILTSTYNDDPGQIISPLWVSSLPGWERLQAKRPWRVGISTTVQPI